MIGRESGCGVYCVVVFSVIFLEGGVKWFDFVFLWFFLCYVLGEFCVMWGLGGGWVMVREWEKEGEVGRGVSVVRGRR